MSGASAALEELVGSIVSVVTNDGRNIVGTLRGFDQMVNLILEESHERVYSPTAGVALEVLGLFVVRGDNVAMVAEVDEEADSKVDFSSLRGEQLGAIKH